MANAPYGSPTWQRLTQDFGEGGTGGGIPEAPTDGQTYGRRGSDTSWQLVTGGGGGVVAWDDITGKPVTFPPSLPIPQSGVTNLVADLGLKAPLLNPIFTGDPRAPTPTAGDNDTSIATTSFVTGAVGTASAGLQPIDPTLTALAGLTGVGLVEQTGVDIFAKRALGVGAATSVPTRADGDARWQPIDATLTALAGLATAADRLPYFTGTDTAALATFTQAARDLLDDANAAAMRTTLGVTSAGIATPSALTKTDDANVTLTLGGTPATALLAATSITAGWSGTLSAARGGFGMSVAASSGVPLFATGVPTFTGTTGTGVFARAADPVFSGAPTVPTATAGTNTLQIASTAFVTDGIATVSTAQTTADALRVLKAGDTMTGPLVMPATGTAAATSINFGTAGTGIFGSSTMAQVSVAGTERFRVANYGVAVSGLVAVSASGSPTNAQIHFGSGNTGFYGTTTTLSATTGGVLRLTIADATITTAVPITLPANPSAAMHAATKQYVDGLAGGKAYMSVGDAPPGGTILQGEMWWSSSSGNTYVYYIDPGGAPGQWVQANGTGLTEGPLDGALYGRAAGSWTKGVKLTGDTMTGQLTLPAGVLGGAYAARRDYVDAVAAYYLPLSGGTITGSLTVNSTLIANGVLSCASYGYFSQGIYTGSTTPNNWSNSFYAGAATGSANNYGVLAFGSGASIYGGLGAFIVGQGIWSVYGNSSAYLSSGSWQASDRELKVVSGERSVSDALASIMAIPVKTYTPITGEGEYETPEEKIGWLSQDIEPYIPCAVRDINIPTEDQLTRDKLGVKEGEPATVKAINLYFLLAELWAAVQALSAKVDALEAS